eukprot:3416284-Rhodomonas_salina.1
MTLPRGCWLNLRCPRRRGWRLEAAAHAMRVSAEGGAPATILSNGTLPAKSIANHVRRYLFAILLRSVTYTP